MLRISLSKKINVRHLSLQIQINKYRYKFQQDLAIALQLINQLASSVSNARLNGRLIDIKQNA